MNAREAIERICNHDEEYREQGERIREVLVWKLWNQVVDQSNDLDNYFGELNNEKFEDLFSQLEKIELKGKALDTYEAAAIIFDF